MEEEKLINKQKITIPNSSIKKISVFPSGNIITILSDRSIKIFDKNLILYENILNAHDSDIIDISIKDENNFATCSNDLNIITWIKMNNENKFNPYQTIYFAHYYFITKIIYCPNGNIISCSQDCTIRIWEKKLNNIYQCMITLTHSYEVYSILLLEDKKILISSGYDGTKFYSLYNYECIYYNTKINTNNNSLIERFDENRIIIGKNDLIQIFSVLEKKIIKVIHNGFLWHGISVFENKGIFLVGGESNDIKIYKSENYECIQIIEDAFNKTFIQGLFNLNNNFVIIYNLNSLGILKLNF